MSTLKFGTILKRSHCMNSVVSENSTQLEHSEKLYSNINKMIDERVKTGKEDFIKNSVSSFLESLCNKTSASNMWSAPLDLLEKFNDLNEGISAKILYEYTNRILPYTEDLDIVNGNLEYLDITKEQKKVIDSYLRKHDSIQEQELYEKMGFPENWRKITRYRK